MAKAKILKTIDKLIEEKARKVREKKGRPASLLKLIIDDIKNLREKGYDYKTINEIINNSFDVNINYNTFFKWIKRNITENSSKTLSIERTPKNNNNILEKEKNCSIGLKRSNIEGERNITTTKSNKEVQDEKSEVKEKKVNPVDVLNSDIFTTDNEYKNLL